MVLRFSGYYRLRSYLAWAAISPAMKHTISLATLLVLAIAMLSRMLETACSLILGIAAQGYTIKAERSKESDARLQHVQQRDQLGRIESEVRSRTRAVLLIAIFYTLRHTPNAGGIEQAFSGVNGFKNSHSDILGLLGSVRLGWKSLRL